MLHRYALVTSLSCLLLVVVGCGHVGKPQVIYLSRHGQTEWNRVARMQGDPDLDAVGYINRLSLWQLLRNRPIHSIFTSERQRTRQTAELVARQHQLPIQTRASLNEINPGVFEGICFSQLMPQKAGSAERSCEVESRGSSPEATLRRARPLFRQAWGNRINGRFPLGQSFRDIADQTEKFVVELAHGLMHREVLVVGHGVVNRALLHHLMKWPLETVTRLRQENDQVYRLEMSETAARLSLYTPGVGWRRCQSAPPRPGQRHLDCHPRPPRPRATPPRPVMPVPPAKTEPDEPPPAASQPAV